MLFNVSIATGILGLFIAFPLLVNWRRQRAHAWLGAFLFGFSWLSLAVLYLRYPRYLFGVFDWPVAALGSAYYCYVREVVGLANGRRQAWHFLPLLAWALVLAWARLSFPAESLYRWVTGPGAPTFMLVIGGFQLLTLVYAVLSGVKLYRYRRYLRENYSSLEHRDLRWLVILSSSLALLMILWVPAVGTDSPPVIVVFIGARLVVLYLLGWFGLRHAVLFNAAPSAPAREAAPKYARSGMKEDARELIGARLRKRAEVEQDYLENDIKLSELAERIGTSPQLLSQYLNDELGVNFFEYINGLRIAAVQRMMCDPAHAGRPIVDLAYAAGFNSKSTFNAAFKKVTGQSPSSWRAGVAATAS
ncbi:MAG: helix-turn-helix domain-containing protein [Telluria sp.]